MAELYIFNQDDKLLTILSESTGLTSAPFRDELNKVPSEPFIFTINAYVDRSKYVKEENRVVFHDREGYLREYVIKELDDNNGVDGPETEAICIPSFVEELNNNIVVDRRFVDKEAQDALDAALEGTRFTGNVEASFGKESTNFYYLSSLNAIWKVRNTWGGDINPVVYLNANKTHITKREIQLKQRLGADNGLRFEIDHNIDEIQRTVLSYPVTALYGRGASLETDAGGHTRYIDFSEVEWKKSKGDPVDKPLGQKWVGDPNALQKYGYKKDGQLLHREGIFSNQEYEDPKELLLATWSHLQDAQHPEVNYRLQVDLLDKTAQLGDTAVGIDREFTRPIEIQTRIIAIEYDLLDVENTTVVEMGQFLSVNDNYIDREIDEIKESLNKPRPTTVTDGSYPDSKPSTPVNVEAIGGIETIQLYWDYADEIFIKHYEVYGSQIKDFVPDEQHLLWRGQVSAFAHTVGTDQKWYYRIRAVNYQGRPSDWSVQVEASTRRVISDDILFGEILSDHLSDNLDIADKLAQNTIDKINAGPMEAIEYTQEEIEATENRLLDQLDNRIGDVNASINDLLERASGIEGTVTNIERNIDTIEGTLSTTITKLTNIDDVVSQHTLDIKANAEGLSAKAEKSEVYTRTATDNLLGDKVDLTVYNNKVTQLDIDISGISGRVSNTETNINDLTGEMSSALSQIGELDVRANKVEISVSEVRKNIEGMGLGENLIPNGSFENDDFGWRLHSRASIYSSDSKMGSKSLRITSGSGTISQLLNVDEIEVIPGHTYRIEYWCKTSSDFNGVSGNNKLRFGFSSNETSTVHNSIGWTGAETEWVKKTGTWKIPNDVSKVKPQIMSNHTTGWVLWDGIVFKDITEISQLSSEVTKLDSSITTLAGQVELKASQTSVNSLTGRMSNAEGAITTNANNIKLKVNEDGVIASINLSKEGVRIDGSKHHITGQTEIDDAVIGTGAIANAAISRAKLQEAIITTAHVDYLSGTKLVAGTVNADRLNVANLAAITANLGTVTAGILESKNNNTNFNLNTGVLHMSNANITLGGGANISFQSSGNGIRYRLANDSAGIVLSTSSGHNLPFVGVGVSNSTSSGGINASDSSFRGLRVHSRRTDYNTNLIDLRFTVSELPDLTAGGFIFQASYDGSNRRFTPMNSSGRTYDLGSNVNRWNNAYIENIYGSSSEGFHFRNPHGSAGWKFDLQAASGATTVTFRGINTGSWSYNLGSSGYRMNSIYLRNDPNVSSDERLKTDITTNKLGLSFINDIETKQFRLKQTSADIQQNKIQFGIVAQQVIGVLEKHNIDLEDTSIVNMGDDGMYGVQQSQFIAPLIKSVQEVDLKFTDEVDKLKLKIQYLEGKIKQLEGAA